MRTISPLVTSIIDGDAAIEYFVLVSIQLSTGTLAYTSLPYNITISGLGTFLSGRLMGYDAPSASTTDDRNEYQIILSDLDQSLENALVSDKAFSAPMRVMLGFYDPTTRAPIKTAGDQITIYEGIVDTWISQFNPGERTLMIRGTNPTGSLDWSNPYWTSPSTTKSYHATDTTFDFNGSLLEDEVAIKWGKK